MNKRLMRVVYKKSLHQYWQQALTLEHNKGICVLPFKQQLKIVIARFVHFPFPLLLEEVRTEHSECSPPLFVL